MAPAIQAPGEVGRAFKIENLKLRIQPASSWLQHHDPLAASGIPDPSSDGQTSFCGKICEPPSLIFTNLEDRPSARSEQPRQIGKQPAHQIESVHTAIESSLRIVADLRRKTVEVSRRYVGEVGHYEVPRRCNRGCEIADE